MLLFFARNRGAAKNVALLGALNKNAYFSHQRAPWVMQVASTKSVCGKSAGGGGSKHTVSYKPYCAPPQKPHDKKNMDLNRPMSPHLTIYAPTLPAMTSIAQRITGCYKIGFFVASELAPHLVSGDSRRVATSVGVADAPSPFNKLNTKEKRVVVLSYALLLSAGALFLPNGVESYVSMIQSFDLSRSSIFVIKALLGAPFAFHYANGIRYCAWNAGKWLALKDVYATAQKAFIVTGVLTFLFALL
ncbi:unnamed protein product, partial [Iphiclides podalirius]